MTINPGIIVIGLELLRSVGFKFCLRIIDPGYAKLREEVLSEQVINLGAR